MSTTTDVLKSFQNKKVLLIGDTILDVYIYGKEVSKALDVPVPEAEETHSSLSFGGASLVGANILALGGSLVFFSVIGNDAAAKEYDAFSHPKLRKCFLVDKMRKTTVKRRWFIDGKKLLQLNVVDNHPLSRDLEKKLLKRLEPFVKKADVMVVMDPQHGLLTKNIIKRLLSLSKKEKKPLYVDAQISHRPSNHSLYKGVDCMFFNEREAKAAYPSFDIRHPEKSLRALRKKFQLRDVVVKLGERGAIALLGDAYFYSPAHTVRAIDVCGAGDAFLAAFSLGDRKKPKETLALSTLWGALSTTIHGTIPPKRKDLAALVSRYGSKG